MNKEFVPYEQALALKELGFNEPCFGVYYTKDGDVRIITEGEQGNAPTYSQVFRWFREKYDLLGRLEQELSWEDSQTKILGYSGKWCYGINNILDFNINYNPLIPSTDLFDTYEEAELACLIKLIEIVKNK